MTPTLLVNDFRLFSLTLLLAANVGVAFELC